MRSVIRPLNFFADLSFDSWRMGLRLLLSAGANLLTALPKSNFSELILNRFLSYDLAECYMRFVAFFVVLSNCFMPKVTVSNSSVITWMSVFRDLPKFLL